MDYMKLGFMLKRANLSNAVELLPDPANTVRQPKAPKTPKGEALKLTTQLGKSRPAFTHEMKRSSPYNTN